VQSLSSAHRKVIGDQRRKGYAVADMKTVHVILERGTFEIPSINAGGPTATKFARAVRCAA
jgi:hypothetical protein